MGHLLVAPCWAGRAVFVVAMVGLPILSTGSVAASVDNRPRDRETSSAIHGTTKVVSISSDGEEANGGSEASEITADGRFVVFWSKADNLVDGDSNGWEDIFVHDCATGLTERASIHTNGTQGGNASYGPDISDDGRFVAFYSYANNLVDGDTNKCGSGNCRDIFVRDRVAGVTIRVSVSSEGDQAERHSTSPAISGDGRYVAFYSAANNLVPDDENGNEDVFVHDLVTSETTRVSVRSGGGEIRGGKCSQAQISRDGRYVAFSSTASDVVAGDEGEYRDVFVHDRETTETERISLNVAGMSPNGNSSDPQISDDGRYVAFSSSASDLVPDDMNDKQDTFLYDRHTGEMRRVSVSTAGAEGDHDSTKPALSPDGRYVAFQSDSSTFVPAVPEDGTIHIYLHDALTGKTVLVSQSADGEPGAESSNVPGVSSWRAVVVFHSSARNLSDPSYEGRKPGIFVHVRPTASYVPLLARPPER